MVGADSDGAGVVPNAVGWSDDMVGADSDGAGAVPNAVGWSDAMVGADSGSGVGDADNSLATQFAAASYAVPMAFPIFCPAVVTKFPTEHAMPQLDADAAGVGAESPV